jgi:Asp-tRNA(Asn)/Glu-tRNA(Gln) amidotransferase A subunit family amidase
MLMRRIAFCLASLFCAALAPAQETITKQDIFAAARVADIRFSPREADSMHEGILENLALFKRMHGIDLPNSVPMSLLQMPWVPGQPLNKPVPIMETPISWDIPKKTQLPANSADLAFYSIPQLSSLLQRQKISSEELTRFFIDRIRKFGDSLQCVISVTEDIALAQARQADAEIKAGKWRGPLHGIPYGLKDLFAVKGTKTTWGAAPYKEQTIDVDAAVYEKLREAGAVLVAKFTLGALAMGDRWYGGQTKNPWNLSRGSSGSSAGSASATVAGLVPFAIGTETWGSIISPSSTCGATGLRPTFGRVSRYGGMALSWSLDKVGPICRSATDCAIVFEVIRGSDPRDGGYPNMPFEYNSKADVKKLRIGYAKNYFDRITDTARNEWKVLQAFKDMDVELVPMTFPDSTVWPYNIIDVVISAECAAAFDGFTRGELDDQMTNQGKNDWPNIFRTARLIPAVEYINANRQRTLLMQAVNEAMNDFDVIISPTFGSGNQSAITNLTGHPAICVPTGFDKRFNVPTSITFIANLYDEATLIRVAKAYQDATGWDEMHPDTFR